MICLPAEADPSDLVPFEKYAKAALSLISPSSAARALATGAPNIEPVVWLVQTIAAARGKHLHELDRTVALVDLWLANNRAKVAGTFVLANSRSKPIIGYVTDRS